MPYPPKWDSILVVYGLEKKYRKDSAGDIGAGSVQILFFKSPPYVHYFPERC
jgi:hypothetical protein